VRLFRIADGNAFRYSKIIARAAVAEVIRVCEAMRMAVANSEAPMRKVHTGPANVDEIGAGVARLGKKGEKLTITALADELKTTRQNLNRAINSDLILRSAYNHAVTEAQRKRAGRRN